ncbi:hypothetical protein [Paraburkholderia sp. J67]|uniref:hypothetical protein n=1 Tax=Paraburkholderia sp. J67 TaxID=2805435 RepID=UPI002ABD5D13|nr:hypothetical protein [Paraburkholderia sp. J67]
MSNRFAIEKCCSLSLEENHSNARFARIRSPQTPTFVDSVTNAASTEASAACVQRDAAVWRRIFAKVRYATSAQAKARHNESDDVPSF